MKPCSRSQLATARESTDRPEISLAAGGCDPLASLPRPRCDSIDVDAAAKCSTQTSPQRRRGRHRWRATATADLYQLTSFCWRSDPGGCSPAERTNERLSFIDNRSDVVRLVRRSSVRSASTTPRAVLRTTSAVAGFTTRA